MEMVQYNSEAGGHEEAQNGVGGSQNGGGNNDQSRAGSSSQSARGKRKGNHRHTHEQIEAMEAYFKDYPHPDETQRNELATRLGLDPSQVKFWFQNKRTQLKAQTERQENDALRAENDKLRALNLQFKEALKNNSCPKCIVGGTQLSQEGHMLRMENIRLKEEIEMLQSIIARFMDGQTPQNQPIISEPEFPSPYSLDLGNASTNTSSTPAEGFNLINVPSPNDMKQSIIELVVLATEELKMMAMAAEPLWMASSADGTTSLLNELEYLATFPNNFGPTKVGCTSEASRQTARVILSPKYLLDILLNVNEWSFMFSAIVGRALTLEVLNAGVDYDGTLQVIAAEYQIPTPLVPNRESYFARYCKQISDGVWAVVDVSLDNILPTPEIMTCQKRPSGCLIQGLPDGTSKITWIEHVDVDYKGVDAMYKRLLLCGLGFGAKRWVSTLERQCQRIATAISPNVPSTDFNNLLMSSPEGRRGILKLSERMVNSFNYGITGAKAGKWTKVSGNFSDHISLMSRRVMNEPGLPDGTLLSVSTSLVVSMAPDMVFDFFRDHKSRNEWDILSNGGVGEPVYHISCGEQAGNCVSIHKVPMECYGPMLLLQESWSDPVASYIVYAPTEIGNIDVILSGGDPHHLPLLPSGFTILPDGPSFRIDDTIGSLLTVSFQVSVDKSPYADINVEAVARVTKLLNRTCEKIKCALGALGPNSVNVRQHIQN